MNAHARRRSPTPVRVVGAINPDNVEESISQSFKELMTDELVAAPPCSTDSISSRAISHPNSRPNTTNGDPRRTNPRTHTRNTRRLSPNTHRTAVLLEAASRSGADFLIENPADRGDPSRPWLFHYPEHSPVWLDIQEGEAARLGSGWRGRRRQYHT